MLLLSMRSSWEKIYSLLKIHCSETKINSFFYWFDRQSQSQTQTTNICLT